VEVRIGAAEIGQGVVGIAAQVAAEVLGGAVGAGPGSGGRYGADPDGGATTASRQTFVTGNAVRLAAEEVRAKLALTSTPVPAEGGWGEGGRASATHIYTPPPTTALGQPGDDHFAYGFATQAALVEVDTQSGAVRVLKVVAAHDVGRAINPRAVVGQVEGGVLMGIGYALSEELLLEQGHVKNADLRRYKVPRSLSMPEIVPILVEAYSADGPFGAKGVGEITSIPTAPAITNAIYAAVGTRVTRLPCTLEWLAEELGKEVAADK